MEQCAHFPACGGCTSQHVSYADQLRAKEQGVRELFPEFSIPPIIPCEHPWHYRNKMEFSFSQDKAGNRFLGLILRKSRGKVFNLHTCQIAPPSFAPIVQATRAWWEAHDLSAFHPPSGKGTLRTLTLRASFFNHEIMAILTVSGNPAFAIRKSQVETLIQLLSPLGVCHVFLQIQQAIPGKPTQWFEMHMTGKTHLIEELVVMGRALRYMISPTSFFQPNPRQASLLYTTALSLPQLTPTSTVYDLYCGTGTLGLACAHRVARVIGIELNPHAIFDARDNAALNQIGNATFYAGDVAAVLAKESLPLPDLVIVDPPRAGLDPKMIATLRHLKAPQLLFISCNPVTQAENLRMLPEYSVAQFRIVDQFPHTPHVETIAFLTYNGAHESYNP